MAEKVLSTLNNISKEKAWKMIDKFRQHYKGNKFPGAEHLSHGVWFSFEDLNKWINEAKDCSGVRIYFATYLDNEPHPSRNIQGKVYNYKHRNTVVLIATKKVGNIEQDQYITVNQKLIDDPFNKGELCPEECGEIV